MSKILKNGIEYGGSLDSGLIAYQYHAIVEHNGKAYRNDVVKLAIPNKQYYGCGLFRLLENYAPSINNNAIYLDVTPQTNVTNPSDESEWQALYQSLLISDFTKTTIGKWGGIDYKSRFFNFTNITGGNTIVLLLGPNSWGSNVNVKAELFLW